MGLLCRYTFNSHMTDVSPLACMLERDRTDIALCINIKNRVFIKILRIVNVSIAELNV